MVLLPTIEVLMNTHLKPGTFVRLKNQPDDLPDFVMERDLGHFCLIQQEAWGGWVQWKVEASRIEAPLEQTFVSVVSQAVKSALA